MKVDYMSAGYECLSKDSFSNGIFYKLPKSYKSTQETNVSKRCADFSTQNVVDIPHSFLGKDKEKFKSEAMRLLGKINVLDENNCYHIVIYQLDSRDK